MVEKAGVITLLTLVLVVIVGTIVLTFTVGTTTTELVVSDAETGEELLVIEVSEGTLVTLSYTHSVEKTLVRDIYNINGTSLQMERMEFNSYGAGLPAQANVSQTDDGVLVTSVNRTADRLHVSPGSIANHTLTIGENETYDLVSISHENSITISVRTRSDRSINNINIK